MLIILSGIALGVGLLGVLLSLLVPTLAAPAGRAEERVRIGPGLVVGLTLVIVLFLVTLPKTPPFSPGQRLGWGYLVGGLAALLVAVVCRGIPEADREYWPYPSISGLSMALAAVALTLLSFRSDPGDALLGCALGFTVVAGVFRLLYAPARAGHVPRALGAGAALAATLAAACTLGVYHFGRSSEGGWAFPLALAAFWLLGALVAYYAAVRKAMARYPVGLLAMSGAISAVLTVGLGALLGAELAPVSKLVLLLASGVVTGALIVWLAIAAQERAADGALAVRASGLAVLLALFLLVLGYKVLGGFGVAIALLAGWGLVAAALGMGGMVARLPVQAMLIGANLLLLQLFLERSGASMGEVQMSLHYTLVGVMLGALLPAVFSALVVRPGLVSILLPGALGALSPLVVLTFWGPDSVLGLMVGLVAAQGMAASLPLLSTRRQVAGMWQAAMGPLALGMALLATQFSRPFGALYTMPRVYKLYLAAGLAAIVVLWAIGLGLVQIARERGSARAGAALGDEI